MGNVYEFGLQGGNMLSVGAERQLSQLGVAHIAPQPAQPVPLDPNYQNKSGQSSTLIIDRTMGRNHASFIDTLNQRQGEQ